MGWREQDRLPEIFSDAVRKLKPGEVSDVFRSPAGFPSVEAQRSPRAAAAARSSSSRLTCGTSSPGSASSCPRRRRAARSRCSGRASSRARTSPSSRASTPTTLPPRQRGGDLGWIVPGDLVPGVRARHEGAQAGRVSGTGAHAVRPALDPGDRHGARPISLRTANGSKRARCCASARATSRTRSGSASCATALTSSIGWRSGERGEPVWRDSRGAARGMRPQA